MQTPPPPYIQSPQQPVPPQKQSRTGMFVATGIAVVVFIIGALLYVSARSDIANRDDELRSLRGQLEKSQADLATAQKTITTTKGELTTANKEAKTAENKAKTVIGCEIKMFDSWYNTGLLSFDATGRAFGRAVFSRACDEPQRAYLASQ